MATGAPLNWYLVRTKVGKERWARDQLSRLVPEVFLPLLKVRRRGRVLALSPVPLFPCYLFARFALSAHYFDIKYMSGVRGLVLAGRDASAVPASIVEEIRQRGIDGVVEIKPELLHKGERVRIINGALHGFDAVFERYLSGTQRVAILLQVVETTAVKVILPAESVISSP